jgi:hypothetical protein
VTDGICTLANDRVYDQLIALLNSIEAIAGSEMPVCIYPYDHQTERIAQAIANRPNVQLYDDQSSMQRWDQFVRQVWDAHPTARQRWGNPDPQYYHRVGTHRRFCAFDGPFDRFLYMDADTLLMDSVRPIFDALGQHDWVVYDFQFTDLSHVYEESSPQLQQVFSAERLQTEIFCSGFYAAQKGLFDATQRDWLLAELRQGDAAFLYPMAPDQTILNYMVMKSGLSACNLALTLPAEQRTGCCVTSDHFTSQDQILYDRGKRLTYLHYIGLSSKIFERLCQGENLEFPYRDLFLHYRYLHEPNQAPVFVDKPKPYNALPRFHQRVFKKLTRLTRL